MSITIAQAAVLATDQLVAGVIEEIVTVNQLAQIIPIAPVASQAYSYNRELTLAQAAFVAPSALITSSNATYQRVSRTLTTLIGQTDVDGLIESVYSYTNDQVEAQIRSLSKAVGLKLWASFATGDGSANQLEGLTHLVDPTMVLTHAAPISFDVLDQAMYSIKDKGGAVDFWTMNSTTLRYFRNLIRTAPGNRMGDMITLPNGVQVMEYNGIPVFRNDNFATGDIFVGTVDDGTAKHGVSLLTSAKDFGFEYQDLGISQTTNAKLHRVLMYCGTALHSTLGLAQITGITG